jgi:hypothetical protein
MSSTRLSLALLLASCLPLCAAPDGGPAAGQSSGGMWRSIKGGLGHVVDGAASVAKTASGAVVKAFDFSKSKRLPVQLDIQCSANPVRLGANQPLGVRLQVFNKGKKTQLLEFSSGQRAEVVLRDATGKIVGRSLNSAGEEGGFVTLNSGERMEYLLQVPTRGLVAGNLYSLEAAITGQAGLVAKLPLRVEP